MKQLLSTGGLVVVLICGTVVFYPQQSLAVLKLLFEFVRVICVGLVWPVLQLIGPIVAQSPWLVLVALLAIIALRLVGVTPLVALELIGYAIGRLTSVVAVGLGLIISGGEWFSSRHERRADRRHWRWHA